MRDPKNKPEYNTLTIEAARTGWIVKEHGRPAEVFIRWESLLNYIASRLTSAGDNNLNN